MSLKKIFYLILGFVGLGLGVLGTVVLVLPTVPFLMLAAFGFAKSSDRLHQWFVGTKLYKENLECFACGKGMTKKTKIRIIVLVTLTMGVGFAMMHRVPAGRIILVFVWVFHILYFVFGIKTISEEEAMHIRNNLAATQMNGGK